MLPCLYEVFTALVFFPLTSIFQGLCYNPRLTLTDGLASRHTCTNNSRWEGAMSVSTYVKPKTAQISSVLLHLVPL